jgi:hypothetical protein
VSVRTPDCPVIAVPTTPDWSINTVVEGTRYKLVTLVLNVVVVVSPEITSVVLIPKFAVNPCAAAVV